MSSTLELLSDLPCVSGAKALGYCWTVDGREGPQLDHADSLDAVILPDTRTTPSLRQVVRVVDSAAAIRYYRIQTIGRTLADGRRTIRGLSPLFDLGTSGLVRASSGTGVTYAVGGVYSLSDFLDLVVLTNLAADGLSHWAKGTVPSTETRELYAPDSGWTYLQWLRQLEETFALELRVRPNGTTSMLIDFATETGSTGAAVPIALGKSILSLAETLDDAEAATAIATFGDTIAGVPASIAENAWKISAISGAGPYWVTLADPAGGAAPIAFAAQFGTASTSQPAYLLTKTATTVQITDARITPDNSVSVASSAGLAVGDLVQLVADSSANRLVELRAPNAARLFRVDTVAGVRGERNLLRNGLFAEWTSLTALTGWSSGPMSKYPRNSTTSFSATAVRFQTANGGVTYYSLSITAGPADFVLHQGDVLKFLGTQVVVSATTQLNGSGAATLPIIALSLAATTATITFDPTLITRPTSFPDDGTAADAPLMRLTGDAASYTWPPTGSGGGASISDVFRVKTSTLQTVRALVGVTQVAYTSGLANLDSGGAATNVAADVVTRKLPGFALLKAGAIVAYDVAAQALGAYGVGHYTLAAETTVSADADLRVYCYPGAYNTAATQLGQTYFRYAMLWLDSEATIPLTGDAGGPNVLWQRANRALLARGLTARQIRVSLRDLSAAAGYSVTREQLTIGTRIPLEAIGVTVRIIGLGYSLTDAGDVDVLLDARPQRLTKFLSERIG